MKSALFFNTLISLPLAEDGPGSDPFAGISTPFMTLVILIVVILVIWWLLRAQTSQVDEVHVDDHDHDDHDHDDHDHDVHGHDDHAADGTAAAEVPLESEPGPEPEPEPAADEAAKAAGRMSELETESDTAADVPPPPVGDDLTRLEGIGPKVQAVLLAAGIKTFDQLGGTDVDHIQELLDAAEYQYMDPASWPEQARLAAAGDWDALQKLQDELIGGR
jgi:predicted flap endonuclease-1-like 5' DNA nuclease